MIVTVDPGRALPVSEQIREQVTRMVASGTLQVGQRLPTIRQLATDLGLAKGTIERAYELLESDALIESRGRKGTFVRKQAAINQRDRTKGLDVAADTLVVIARQLGADEAAALDAVRRAWQRF